MKKLIVTTLACACVLAAGAQSRWGFQAGATFDKLKASDIDKHLLKSNTGFLLGLTFDYDLIGPLGLNTGLFYVQRSTETADVTTRFSSLELPLNAKVTIPLIPMLKPFVTAGAYLDCGVGAKAGGHKLDYGDDLNRFNYGFIFGVGVDVMRHFRVMYQYDLGMSDMTTSASEALRDAKVRGNRISAALLF